MPKLDESGMAVTAPLGRNAKAGGLLLAAVQKGTFEQPTWCDVDWDGVTARVGMHALRAPFGERMLRLPVSWQETLAITKALGWIPPTQELADAIWRAAHVRLEPDLRLSQTTELWRIMTIDFAIKHNDRLDERMDQPWERLTADEGKDWIFSKRNLARTQGATTLGWRRASGGMVQEAGDDFKKPAHTDDHYDYSQVLRPIQRMATRSDGTPVDLLDVYEERGIPAAVLAPLRK